MIRLRRLPSLLLIVVPGMVLAWAAIYVYAYSTDECSADWGVISRSVNLFPPSVECVASKDSFTMPWDTAAPQALLLAIIMGIAGSMLGRYVGRQWSRRGDDPGPTF